MFRAQYPDGEGLAPVFAESDYDFRTGRWTWSPAMYSLLGVAETEDPVEEVVYPRMHPEDRRGIEDLIRIAVETARPVAGQYRMRGDDGQERSIAFVCDVLHDEHGAPVRIHGVSFDVSAASRRSSDDAVAAATQDRAAIEQVKGALMFAYGLDADAAFGVLSRYSQRGNVKLSVIAGRVATLLSQQSHPGTERSLLQVLEQALDDDAAASGSVRSGNRPRTEAARSRVR